MRNRNLFFIGIILLLLTLFGLAVLATRSPSRAVMASTVRGESLLPSTTSAATPTPVLISELTATTAAPNLAVEQLIPVLSVMALGALLALFILLVGVRRSLLIAGGGVLGICALGVLLLGFVAARGVVSQRLDGCGTCASLPPVATETSLPNVLPTFAPAITPPPTGAVVSSDYPTRMEVGHEDSIHLLIQSRGQLFVPTPEATAHTAGVVTVIPIGTPAVPLGQALGPNYQGCATAELDAPAFSYEPKSQSCTSVNQAVINLSWTLDADGTQLQTGTTEQTVTAIIWIRWEPIAGGQELDNEIWQSRMEIMVEKPLITIGQISVSTLLAGFLGSGFSVPWLYERFREREGKKKEPKKKGESSATENGKKNS